MKHFLFLMTFIISTVAQATDMPSYNGNVERWEKEMMIFSDWKNFYDKKSSSLNPVLKEAWRIVEIHPNRPRLRIILGRLYGFKAGILVKEAREKGVKVGEKITDPNYIEAVTKTNESYEMAVELDSGELEMSDYDSMLQFSLDSKIRIAASRKQLKLIDEGVWPPKDIETDHPEVLANYDYTLYERIVTAYIDERRFDEALAVINNEMVDRFPRKGKEIKEGIANIQQRKERYLQEIAQKSEQQEKAPQTTDIQNPAPIKEAAPQQPVAKAEPTPQQPAPEQTTDHTRLILIGLVLVVVLVAGVMVTRRRKK